jgi:hypothetical protein
VTAALVAALLAGAPATDSPAGFYLGSLSGPTVLAVGLELRIEGGALAGEYYYLPMGEPIPLRGRMDPGGTVRLEEGAEGRVTGRWSGRVAKGHFEGTWRNAKTGRAWTFDLARSELATDFFAGPAQSTAAGSTGPLTYRMARVPGGIHLDDRTIPIITGFGDRAVTAAVNSTLVGIARHAHCQDAERDDYEQEAAVSFVGQDVFSVHISDSWMCGAPYPTAGSDASITLDLHTGRRVAFEDLFEPAAAPRVDRILFAYHYEQAAKAPPPGAVEMDCLERFREDATLLRGEVRFRFSPDGLVVTEDLPHVIAACADELTVPYAALAAVARPGGALARLAAADTRRPIRYRIRTGEGKDLEYSPPAR